MDKFKYPSISENMETFSELIDPFKLTVDREILTTEIMGMKSSKDLNYTVQ